MFTVYDDGFKPIADAIRSTSKIDVLKGDFSSLIPKDVENFVLSPEMALSVDEFSRKFNCGIDTGDYRLPYKSVVVELPITPEIIKLRGGVVPGRHLMSRVAALITQEENVEARELYTSITPFWQFTDGKLGLATNTFYFGNWGAVPATQPVRCFGKTPDVELYTANAGPSLLFLKALYCAGFKATPERLQILNRDVFFNSDYVSQGAEEITALLFAWLSILDCKSGVRSTRTNEVKPKNGTVGGKLGKRIAAKKSCSAYTTISIIHSEVEIDGKVKRNPDISAHTVRGHFKKRATGTFWWHPFIRGTGAPRKRDAYIVKP